MWICRQCWGWGSHQPPQRCFLLAAALLMCGTLPPCSSGKALPQGGAGAVRDHEEVCPDPGARGARQVHREPRAWVPAAHTAKACIISFLNRSLSCRAGGGFPPPPPSNYLRKTNPFVVWYVEWVFSTKLCPSSLFEFTLTEHSGHVLKVIFFYLKTTVYLLGLCIRGRIKSLCYGCVERLGAGSKLNSLKGTRSTIICHIITQCSGHYVLTLGERHCSIPESSHSLHLGRFQSESPHPAPFWDLNWESCCSLERTKHLRSCAPVFRTPCVKCQKHDPAKSWVPHGSAAPGTWFCCCSGCRSSGEPVSKVQETLLSWAAAGNKFTGKLAACKTEQCWKAADESNRQEISLSKRNIS